MKLHTLIIPAIACVCMVSCGDNKADEFVKSYSEAADIFASIKDKDSADANAEKAGEAQKKMLLLAKEIAANPELAKDVSGEKAVAASKKYTDEVTRVTTNAFYGSEKLQKAITDATMEAMK